MILIDTSVWIEYFRQKDPYASHVRTMLVDLLVITIEPVFSELLCGARDSREKNIILSYWQVLPRIEFGSNSMLEAAEYARSNGFQEKGIGLMDAILIKSSMEGNYPLWTMDKRLNQSIVQKLRYMPDF